MPKRFLMILNGCSTLARMLVFDLFDALLQSSIRRIRQRPCACPDAWRFPLNLAPWFSSRFLSALVAGITHAKPFFSMQQGMGLGDIADVG